MLYIERIRFSRDRTEGIGRNFERGRLDFRGCRKFRENRKGVLFPKTKRIR